MPLIKYEGKAPDTSRASFIADDADIIGEVVLGRDSGVWFHSTLRGDISGIYIGEKTNIQDNCIIHGEVGLPTILGDQVTVGHGAILHGCTIGNRCLIGMGSIIMSRVEIGDDCVIGAGALITENTKIPSGSVVMGVPGRVVKETSQEQKELILKRADIYVERGKLYLK